MGDSEANQNPQNIGGASKRYADKGQNTESTSDRNQDSPPNHAEFRAQFYEKYQEEAKEYDEDFMNKRDSDLDTTLIFAGLFSAVTSAFIIQVHSQLQQDPNDVAVALLRVLIYTLNNTAFGGGPQPTVPQWTGPPTSLVQVQSLLYASLGISLFAAFLAMLGKQWLNRYIAIDMRGSAIERSQNRQRKLDGIVTWYFDYVMQSLSLMLQIAFLLLGCALSQYLWSIDITIAVVILSFTVFSVAFYAFIVLAGTVFKNCPYQTPYATFFRFLWRKVTKRFKSPTASQSDVELGPVQALGGEVTILDFRCISWVLRTSLDRKINRLTLGFLASVLTHPGFNDGIVADCLNVLLGCISIANYDQVVVVTKGSEELAEMGGMCLLRALSHRLVERPSPRIPKFFSRRYKSVFRSVDKLSSLPFYHTIAVAHYLITGDSPNLSWDKIDPSTQENRWLAHNLVKIAWHQRHSEEDSGSEVADWILKFSDHCLSHLLLVPEPPLEVIADCLSITAIYLGCNVPRLDVMEQDKSTRLWDIMSLISNQLQWVDKFDHDAIELDCNRAATLFLWVTRVMIANEPQGFDERIHGAPHLFLDAVDRIHSDPRLAMTYVDVLLKCVDVKGGRVMERPSLEQTASAASICLLRSLSCVDWKVVVGGDIPKRYASTIPSSAISEGLRGRHTVSVIHMMLSDHKECRLDWTDYKPCSTEHSLFANTLGHILRARPRLVDPEVPRWILHFVLHSLSQDPPPPASVIPACLSIIAIGLGCNVPSLNDPPKKSASLSTINIPARNGASQELVTAMNDLAPKSIPLGMIVGIITRKLEEMVEGMNAPRISSKHEALTALLPYVALRVDGGMLDAFKRIVTSPEGSGLMRLHIVPLLSTQLDEKSPNSSKRAAILASPHVPWWQFENGEELIQLWAKASSAVPYTDDIGQSVVDALLQIACWESPTIPDGMWSWLNKRPKLPLICSGRHFGSSQAVVKMVRELKDTKTFTSYLLLVWSEWDSLVPEGFEEMCASIREDFCRKELSHYRKGLLDHLGHVQRELGQGIEYIQQHKPGLKEEDLRRGQDQYKRLKEILLEVDKGARNRSNFMCAIPPLSP